MSTALERLLELEARLEKAPGPDRMLDFQIAELTGGFVVYHHNRPALEDCTGRQVEHYTSSIDAALTLVPEGWCWFIGHLDQGDRRFAATIQEKAFPDVPTYRAVSHEPAPALCLAAIRARITQAQP